MALLSKKDILTADDLPFEDVKVPEWGGTVRVRTMTGTERDAFEGETYTGKGANTVNMRARICARCIIGDDGQRLFEDRDMAELGAKSAASLDRVFAVAQRLNGFSDADVEVLEKN